jgi:hypothetical protein
MKHFSHVEGSRYFYRIRTTQTTTGQRRRRERERERAKSGEDYRSEIFDLRVTDLVVVDGHRGELTVDIVNVLETTPGAIGFVFD